MDAAVLSPGRLFMVLQDDSEDEEFWVGQLDSLAGAFDPWSWGSMLPHVLLVLPCPGPWLADICACFHGLQDQPDATLAELGDAIVRFLAGWCTYLAG